MSEYVKPDKPYAEWTPAERAAHSKEGRRKANAIRAEREAQAAARDPIKPNPAPAVEQPAPQVVEAALPTEVLGDPDGPAPSEDAAAERRRRLLADVPAELASRISDEQLIAIEEEERKKAESEALKNAIRDIRAVASMHARVATQLESPDIIRSDEELRRMNEEIEFDIAVNMGSMPKGKEGITVNGFRYQAGARYKRPRHVYDSLRWTMYQNHYTEMLFLLTNQDKPGYSAREMLSRQPIQLREVVHAA